MPSPSISYTLTNGTANDAGPVNTNFNDIIAALTDGTKDLTIAGLTCTSVTSSGAISGTNITASGDFLIGTVSVGGALVPIGSIIPFYDFNAALTFDTDNWVYCDGATATVGGASRTLPDLSGRYLVGFGGATDGAGDIDTAAWSTTVVGNSLHQINIAHTHTGPSHTHNLSNSGWAKITSDYVDVLTGGSLKMDGVTATSWTADQGWITGGSDGWSDNGSGSNTTGAGLDGATDSGGTGATGSSGSATQSIQPRSIRVRFIMRKA